MKFILKIICLAVVLLVILFALVWSVFLLRGLRVPFSLMTEVFPVIVLGLLFSMLFHFIIIKPLAKWWFDEKENE